MVPRIRPTLQNVLQRDLRRSAFTTQALLFQIHSEYIIYRVTRQTLLEAIFILPRIRRVLDDFGDFGDPGDVGDLGDFGDLGHIGLSLPSPSVLLDARLWRNRILSQRISLYILSSRRAG
jgi:hypothetical protein